jgi:hypothetical protein
LRPARRNLTVDFSATRQHASFDSAVSAGYHALNRVSAPDSKRRAAQIHEIRASAAKLSTYC